MNNNNKEKLKVIDIQLIAFSISLLTVLAGIILLYNQKRTLKNQKPLFTKELSLILNAINRIVILLVVIVLITANTINLKLDQNNPNQLKNDYLEILGSILTLIVSLISIYLSIKAIQENNLNTDTIQDEVIF